MAFRVREPRQPQKHRGAVVHTEKSVDYDDTITQGLVHATIVGEARASVALDGETQSVEPVPSDASDTDKRKEPAVTKKIPLPGGRQGADVIHAITTYIEIGQVFDADRVWNMMGNNKRKEWAQAYGGRDKAFRKVKVALNNLNYSGRIGIERVDGGNGLFRYLGLKGKPSAAYTRSLTRKNKKAQPAKDPVDKPVSKPVTVAKPSSAVPEHEGYRHVGFDLDGMPLYVDHKTQRVGHVMVVTQFISV